MTYVALRRRHWCVYGRWGWSWQCKYPWPSVYFMQHGTEVYATTVRATAERNVDSKIKLNPNLSPSLRSFCWCDYVEVFGFIVLLWDVALAQILSKQQFVCWLMLFTFVYFNCTFGSFLIYFFSVWQEAINILSCEHDHNVLWMDIIIVMVPSGVCLVWGGGLLNQTVWHQLSNRLVHHHDYIS